MFLRLQRRSLAICGAEKHTELSSKSVSENARGANPACSSSSRLVAKFASREKATVHQFQKPLQVLVNDSNAGRKPRRSLISTLQLLEKLICYISTTSNLN